MKKNIFIVLVLCWWPQLTMAQGATLKQYLQAVSQQYHCFFSFDSDLLEGVPFSPPENAANIAQIVAYLQAETAFYVETQGKDEFLLIPKQKNKNFRIAGKVYAGTEKEALPNALVFDKKGNTAVASDSLGRFEIWVRYAASDSIELRYLGFLSQKIAFSAFAGKNKNLQFFLKEDHSGRLLAPVLIVGYLTNGIAVAPLKNNITINYNQMQLLPGQTDGDIFNTLEALPGINTVDSKPGNLNVRGSTADQTLLTLDDIPVYQRGHLFGAVSNINPALLDQVEVYRNSYGAETGGRVGGAIKIKSNLSLADSSKGNVYSSTMDAAFNCSVPVLKNKVSLGLSARTSYPYSWGAQKMRTLANFLFVPSELGTPENPAHSRTIRSYDIGYKDFNAGLVVRLNAAHVLQISSLYSVDEISAVQLVKNDGAPAYTKKDGLLFENTGLSLNLRSQWKGRWSSVLKWAYSSNIQKFYGATYSPNEKDFLGSNTAFNNLTDVHGGWQITHTGRQNNTASFGYELRYYDVQNKDDVYIPKDTAFKHNTGAYSFLHTLYANYTVQNAGKWRFNLGARVNYYSLSRSFSAEPRATVNYIVSKPLLLKLSGGTHNQFVTQVLAATMETLDGVDAQIWSLSNGKNVKILTGYQAGTGFLYTQKSFVLDVDAYYKYTSGFSALYQSDIYQQNRYISGDIDVYGIDVYLKKGIGNFTFWQTYTYNFSRMFFPVLQAESFPSMFTNAHSYDISGSYRWKNLRLAATWRYRSGLYELSGIRVPFLAGYNLPDNLLLSNPGAPVAATTSSSTSSGQLSINDNTFPAFHQLDFSAMYDCKLGPRLRPYIGLSFLNIYNRRTTILSFANPTIGTTEYKYSLGFTFNAIVGIRW